MQVVYKNEDEKDGCRKTDLVGIVICAEKIGRYLEGEYIGRSERGITRIQDSWRVLGKHKKEVWRGE